MLVLVINRFIGVRNTVVLNYKPNYTIKLYYILQHCPRHQGGVGFQLINALYCKKDITLHLQIYS